MLAENGHKLHVLDEVMKTLFCNLETLKAQVQDFENHQNAVVGFDSVLRYPLGDLVLTSWNQPPDRERFKCV